MLTLIYKVDVCWISQYVCMYNHMGVNGINEFCFTAGSYAIL